MKKKFVILGAGISGLSHAFFIPKFLTNYSITLLEASNRVGGMISTTKKDGFICEEGPRSIRKGKYLRPLYSILNDIDLHSDIVPSKSQPNAYIYQDNKLLALPQQLSFQSIKQFLKDVGSQEAMQLLSGAIKNNLKLKGTKDMSISDYLKESFGKELTQKYVETIYYGIYGTSIDNLSTDLCYKKSHMNKYDETKISKKLELTSEFTQFTNPLLRNSNSFRFSQGLEQLPKEMIKYLQRNQDFKLELNSIAQSIDFQNKTIKYFNGESEQEISYDYLIVDLPLKSLKQLINHQFLENVKGNTLISMNMCFDSNILPEHFKGFGYLINPRQGEQLLGVVMDSLSFPQLSPKNSTNISIMMREDCDDSVVYEQLKKHLNQKIPEAKYIGKRKWENGFLIYEPDHKRKFDQFATEMREKQILVGGGISYSPAVPELIYQSYEQIIRLIEE